MDGSARNEDTMGRIIVTLTGNQMASLQGMVANAIYEIEHDNPTNASKDVLAYFKRLQSTLWKASPKHQNYI